MAARPTAHVQDFPNSVPGMSLEEAFQEFAFSLVVNECAVDLVVVFCHLAVRLGVCYHHLALGWVVGLCSHFGWIRRKVAVESVEEVTTGAGSEGAEENVSAQKEKDQDCEGRCCS